MLLFTWFVYCLRGSIYSIILVLPTVGDVTQPMRESARTA